MTYFGFRMLIVISMGCLFLGTPSAWAQEEGPSDSAVSTASEELRATDTTPGLTSSGEINIEALDIAAFELVFDRIGCIFNGGFFVDNLEHPLPAG